MDKESIRQHIAIIGLESTIQWIKSMLGDIEALNSAAYPSMPTVPYFVARMTGGCCGFQEIDQLSTKGPLEALRELFPRSTSIYRCPAFVFFSQARLRHEKTYQSHGIGDAGKMARAYGDEFANFLRSKDIGDVTFLGERQNKTGRMVSGWVWMPDKSKLTKFLESLESEEKKILEAWSGQIEAARRESDQPGQVDGGESPIQPSGTDGSGIGGGLVETPSEHPFGA